MLNIIVILISYIIAFFAQKYKNKKLLFLTFLWLSLCCGLRNESLGADTSNYITFFYDVKYLGVFYGSDIGFSIVSYILMIIFNNPYILLLIYSLITNYFIIYRLWEFKDTASFSLMILIYSTIYYPYCFNIVRQFIAIALIFWSTKYLKEELYSKYMIINLLAITFHTTAIIGFVFLLFERKFVKLLASYKKIAFKLIFFFIFLISIFFSSNIYKYLMYLINFNFDIHIMTLFKLLCILIICYLNYNLTISQISFKSKKIIALFNNKIILYYFFGLVLSSFGMFFSFMNRIGFYFLMYEMPFWGEIVKHEKYGKFYIIFITIILVLYNIANFA